MDRVGRREQHARQGAPRMVGEPVQTARPHHVNAGHGRRRGGCHRRRRGRSDPGGSTRPWAAILPDLGRPGPAMTDRTATRRGRPPPRTATPSPDHAEARSPSPRRSTSDIQTATQDHRPAVRQSCPPPTRCSHLAASAQLRPGVRMRDTSCIHFVLPRVCPAIRSWTCAKQRRHPALERVHSVPRLWGQKERNPPRSRVDVPAHDRSGRGRSRGQAVVRPTPLRPSRSAESYA
jgi:hypothetical protein